MKKITNQLNESHVDRMNYGGGKFLKFALFPLMLFMLLLMPANMVARTDSNNTSYKAYAEFKNGTLTFKYGTPKSAEVYELNKWNNPPRWSSQSENIRMVVFDSSFAKARPTSCYQWFFGCNNLTTIEGIENLNTEDVTNMGCMFKGCFSLTSLDLTSFNTAKVTEMNSMFNNCSALKTLDLTSFNTANVTNMHLMFTGCFELTTIYASDKFVTTNVQLSSNMFSSCKKLKGYDMNKVSHSYANCGPDGYFTPVFEYAEFDNATGTLTFRRGLSKPEGVYDLKEGKTEPGWRTHKKEIKKVVFDASFAKSRPTSCYYWFYECENLTNIEGIENLKTEKVTNMALMFAKCSALTSLDVTKFNTANVTTLMSMFAECSGLKSLDVTNFDTRNVTNMYFMFRGCSALTSLDLTNFNTAKVMSMFRMFRNCSALTTIYASNKFVTDKVADGSEMFYGCINLKGAIDKYEDSKTDKTYANYKTGYFTKLVGKNGDEKIGATGKALTTENLVLADGKDFVAYEKFAAKDASYSRTINEGTTWATLCLPFGVSLANQNFRAFKLLSADDVAETVELEEIETSIAAGTPVIIKMKDGAKSLSISEAVKAIAKDVQNSETANGNYQLQGIYTQKEFSKDADNHCYIVKGDKLMNPAKLLDKTTTESVGSKPFRAYMVDNSSAPAAGARMFSISVGGSTTAIEQLETTADSKAEYYDLQGRRLQNLQKGVNIVKRGGKTMKVIIK